MTKNYFAQCIFKSFRGMGKYETYINIKMNYYIKYSCRNKSTIFLSVKKKTNEKPIKTFICIICVQKNALFCKLNLFYAKLHKMKKIYFLFFIHFFYLVCDRLVDFQLSQKHTERLCQHIEYENLSTFYCFKIVDFFFFPFG